MHLVLVGLSHKTAPIDLREKLSISKAELPDALEGLARLGEVRECVILSTCNRTEICAYTTTRSADLAIIDWLAQFRGIPAEDFTPHIYTRAGHKTAEHLFRVAPGLDSMTLGETQILGQVKEAYAAATRAGTTGTVLNSLFQQATAVGKRVFSETEIGRGAFSVGSTAARLVRSIFGDPSKSTLLMVGAGKMADLTMSNMAALGVTEMLVANRTYDNGAELASRFNGRGTRFEELASTLAKADIVVSSTGAQGCVITREMVSRAIRSRRGQPMFIIDLAVPRDVEETVASLDNVFLYNIDDLKAVVEANDACRRAELQKADAIVAEEVEEFNRWFRALDVVPVITALRGKFEGIRSAEMEKLSRKLGHLPPEDLRAIGAAMTSILNKMCHEPMIQIKECANGPDSAAKLEAMCEAFGLCLADLGAPTTSPVEDR